MSLLRDIQNTAVDPSTDVSTLLRKCKILAVRLGSEEFKQWVDHELNGYDRVEDLPKYRILDTQSYGNFEGAFGKQYQNAPIPPICLIENHRENATKSYLTGPISSYVALIDRKEKGDSKEPWPANMVVFYCQKIYTDMVCLDAWKVIPHIALVAVVDTIKTRVLNLVLEIEGEAPEAGEAPPHQPPLPQDRVSQVFNTYITGHVQNVATGGSNFKQSASFSVSSDEVFQRLLDAISRAPADSKDVCKMTATVEEMRGSVGTSRFGEHYQAFMSILADHIQVFGPLAAPYLPVLARLMA